MQQIQITQIPQLLKTKKITEQTARNFIWEEIFNNPRKYGLCTLTEDQLSEFLLFGSSVFIQYVKNYTNSSIDFTIFLRACIKHTYKNWLKRQIKAKAGEQCLQDQSIFDFEYRQEKMNEDYIEKNHSFQTKQNFSKTLDNMSKKKQEILKEFIHICACKACNEIDPAMLKNISEFLKMNHEHFCREIEELKLRTACKRAKRNFMLERRNRAFFFHKRSLFELSKIDPSSSCYNTVSEKYENQTNSWKNINSLLKHRFVVSPTVAEISKVTGIKERRVSFFLTHRQKTLNFMPFIENAQNYKEQNGKNDDE